MLSLLQVVSSTNGELQGDDQVGGQSNAPITAPADVENTEVTKYVHFALYMYYYVIMQMVCIYLCICIIIIIVIVTIIAYPARAVMSLHRDPVSRGWQEQIQCQCGVDLSSEREDDQDDVSSPHQVNDQMCWIGNVGCCYTVFIYIHSAHY